MANGELAALNDISNSSSTSDDGLSSSSSASSDFWEGSSNSSGDDAPNGADILRSPSRMGFRGIFDGPEDVASADDAENYASKSVGKRKWVESLFQKPKSSASRPDSERAMVNGGSVAEDEEFNEGDVSKTEISLVSISCEDADGSDADDEDPFADTTDASDGEILSGLGISMAPKRPPLIRTRSPSDPKSSPTANDAPPPVLRTPAHRRCSPLNPNHPDASSSVSTPSRREPYCHRGHSHSSLNYQKWLWHLRDREWSAWREDKEAEDLIGRDALGAYDGITILPGTRSPTHYGPAHFQSSLERDALPGNRYGGANPLAPVFPRMGDVRSLRDPWHVHVDRCFAALPAWTIAKVLWVFDMDHRAVEKQRDALGPEVDSSDDDATLVEGDGNGSTNRRNAKKGEKDAEENAGLYQGVRAWEICWYTRRQLLIELTGREGSPFWVPPSVPVPPSPPKPKFFVGDYDDDDDDEDFGEIVANPRFGKPAELLTQERVTLVRL